jgi:hypothetical protein
VGKVVEAGTDNEGPLYVCLNSQVGLEAKPYPPDSGWLCNVNWSIVSSPPDSHPSVTPHPVYSYKATLSGLDKPGTYVVKATSGCNGHECPGDTITVTAFTIKSETVSPVPANRDRTILGLGEKVFCWTDPPISVEWWISGGGTVNPTSGTSTTFTAMKCAVSYSTVVASSGTGYCTLDFTVIAPDGINVSPKEDVSLGIPGPPNDKIGAESIFNCTVTPTTVSFKWAEFRENIPTDTWIWPDGTQQSDLLHFVPWHVSYDNTTTDTLSPHGGLQPIGRIYDGSSYVNFNYTIHVPEEYKNEVNQWIPWFPSETHPREFRGSDQKARVILNATNSASGSWMGPWQQIE